MGKNRKRISFLAFLLIAVAVALAVPGRKAQAAPKRLSAITAVYTGDTLRVGESIQVDKLSVMGMYSDGSYEKVKDFSLSTYMVTQDGANTIEIYCDGVSSSFVVMGKKAMYVDAYYEDSSATIGESLVREKIIVTVYFTDGSQEKVTDFRLSHTIVAQMGHNEFMVVYDEVSTTFAVTGKNVKKPETFYVRYNGPPVIVGNPPKREDFYVSVFYSDNTTEQITSFEITPSLIQREGKNTVVVSYAGLSEEVAITGLAKTVSSIEAEYTGLPIVVGKAVSQNDIKVTATFNDGTKDTVTNFTLSGSVIYKIGDNLITVFCDQAIAYINVRGVEAEIIDYGNSVYEVIRDSGLSSEIRLAVGGKADPKQVRIEKVSKKSLEKPVRRSIKSDTYMAFEVIFDGPELDSYLPMTMKVSVPVGMDKEMFGVFYTPNKKTIMAQMNGEFLKDGSYEFKMFQPGTYIIADCTPLIYVDSLKLEEEELTLRLGRSYSLNPEILPHTATDKSVKYKSSKPHVVSVSERGKLKALRTGTAIITVTSQDGSGKRAKLRVNVVEKKGLFDAEIAELSDMFHDIETADDYIRFLEHFRDEIEDKAYELEEHEFIVYTRELEEWLKGLDEDDLNMPEDELEYLLEMMLELAEEEDPYWQAVAEGFFGGMFKALGITAEDEEEFMRQWNELLGTEDE